ncbi:MAG: Beta-lactamase class C-like and penicillin binding proteins (PBPs) superfamily [uncultured Nocardioidaceae bacterium]|uniref:Beta-lactamase class C-like and penicillin binding proteins (PBPs) superfamily n=1 Tax=uncultured Nocardioidaceae bacterium TaxID=253824 RepID=A0A6J4LS47_9ACTN|nr:MAG: Beta-lactamase class C-like and penicillin binding proteins (PBPs) superfamily [uncultured Nocardioidaceae bacterium]
MLTTVLVLAVASSLGVCCGVLVMAALHRRGRWVRRIAATLAGVAVTGASVQAWAQLMVDESAVARAIVWREADTGDWQRFPARQIAAGGEPLKLRPCRGGAGLLDQPVTTEGREVGLGELISETGTTSFLVLRDRCLLVEQYGAGAQRDDLQTSFSVAKSFLSTLVGIAVARGEIRSIDEPITTYLPELAERDEPYEDITIRHLITMASGLRYEEHGLPWSDDSLTYYSPDLRDTALSAEVERAPGEEWLYNNYNPLLIGLILERATGQRVADYMQQHLWRPMGSGQDASWSLDSDDSGFEKMESGINAAPRDYARFGYLFAHGGRVDGRQVVPGSWVTEATAVDTAHDPNAAYQYWWWIDTARPHRFLARGNLGQFVYVDAEHDLVVVRTGEDFGIPDWPDVLRQVTDQLSPERPRH